MLRLISTVLSRRLIAAIPTLLMLSLIVFVVLRLIPADPLAMMLPPNATPADAALLRHQLGLDKPIPSQFLIWLVNALHGNLGASISFQQPVATLIGSTLPATLELCLTALVVSLIISVPGGVFAYAVTDRRGELPVGFAVVLMQSVPSFLWALLLIALLGVYLPVLPFSGRVGDGIPMPHLTGFLLIDFLVKGEFSDWLSAASHLVLPSLALAFGFAPLVIRVLRSSLLDAAQRILCGRGAVARGIGEPDPVAPHAEERGVARADHDRRAVRFPVRRRVARRDDLLVSGRGQSDGAGGAQQRPGVDPGHRDRVLRADAGDQRDRRHAVRDHESAPAQNSLSTHDMSTTPLSSKHSSEARYEG